MIPKKIHYCWVGGAPKPQSVLYCIESWKKYCPDYEIIEWNETNYDFGKNQYMSDAYNAQKWGFVPDYARLDIVYNHGGIYLDTDVEMIRNFDVLLQNKGFFGIEDTGEGSYYVALGLGFGSEPNNPLIKELMDYYDNISFYNTDGSLNLLASPHYNSQVFIDNGIKMANIKQTVDGNVIYPSSYFCPKVFKTGKTKLTDHTFSIHHYTASWMDEEIRDSISHNQKIRNIFGNKIGNNVLLLESAIKKYGVLGLVKKPIISLRNHMYGYSNLLFPRTNKGEVFSNKVAIFDTSIDSQNLGDSIIMDYSLTQLSEIVSGKSIVSIPTHTAPSYEQLEELQKCGMKLLCGTNLLSGRMRSYGLWKIPEELNGYNDIITVGVGFDSESDDFDLYTKKLFKHIFSQKYFLSVRDSFSEKKLKRMGIKNVLNTSCPTLWNLTPGHCKDIPRSKSNSVVFTLTDYCTDKDKDNYLIETLISLYDKVYFWVQGSNDLLYLRELGYDNSNITVVYTLSDYDNLLRNIELDYVGTRLHAGIRALNYKRRTIIVSIDNRAKSIAADTKLPIVFRDELENCLREKINSDFKTEIVIPEENIRIWKDQFINPM